MRRNTIETDNQHKWKRQKKNDKQDKNKERKGRERNNLSE